jgi:hypothetical protein
MRYRPDHDRDVRCCAMTASGQNAHDDADRRDEQERNGIEPDGLVVQRLGQRIVDDVEGKRAEE